MPAKRVETPTEAAAFLRALRDPGRNLKAKFLGKPVELAEKLGLSLPKKPAQVMKELGIWEEERDGPIEPGLRELVENVCLLNTRNAVAVGPRGGGKSFGVSFIEFYLWLLCDFDALNLGGSELQADQVYQYLQDFLDSDPYWLSLVKGDPMKEKTFSVTDSWVRVLTASQKSTRSPHAGGKRKGRVRGGLLVIDEEAEADEDIVNSALPTINTAKPSVNVRCSTFHKIGGSFQKVVDRHKEMGYEMHRWDIIDVSERCECVGECQNPEPCFREDHIQKYIDPDDGQEKERLLHKAYSFIGQEVVIVRDQYGVVICTTLKNLYDRFSHGSGKNRVRVPRGWEIFDHVKAPGRWPSCVEWTPLTHVSRHHSEVGLRNIQIGSGDSITVTDDHPFMLRNERENFFVPAEQVRLGDRAVASDVIKYLGSETYSLPSSVAYLIGQYLAEGNCGINTVGSKWVVLSGLFDPAEIETRAKESGFHYRVRPHSVKGWNIYLGAEFYDLLQSLGIGHEASVDKRMPENILEWTQESAGSLLSGLIDGDGSVHHSKPSNFLDGAGCSSVVIRVASKALVSQIQLLLRKCEMSGWVSYVGHYTTGFKANYPLYRIEFSVLQENLRWFIDSYKIGLSFIPRTRLHGNINVSNKVRAIKTAESGQEFVYDVTTGSETFWCSGIRTHNCGGRAMYASGWIPQEEVLALWRRMDRNHATWEVEAMGSRPSSSGHVIRDLNKYAKNIVTQTGEELYKAGCPITIVIDWGTVNAGVEVWQEQPFNVHALLYANLMQENGPTEIIGEALGLRAKYANDFLEFACDIGGGGNYMNKVLRDEHRFRVRDVVFNTEKEAAVAAWNILNESERLRLPAEFAKFHEQVRGWIRRNGQIVKREDHLCDAGVCYFSKFIERMGLSHIRVSPKSFSSNPAVTKPEVHTSQVPFRPSKRVALMKTFGSSRRR